MIMRKVEAKRHSSNNLVRRQGLREIKQSFLIVCEGECTEPDYFNAFRLTTASVRTIGQAMNTVSLVNKAISIREADKQKRRVYDQCWVVFDKDDFPANDFNWLLTWQRETASMWHIATRRLNTGFFCILILIVAEFTENYIRRCSVNFLVWNIARMRGLHRIYTIICWLVSRRQ